QRSGQITLRQRVVQEWPGFEQLLGAREVEFEILARKWPARMGEPAALFEIEPVERARPAAPMIGTAAQIAQPGRIQRNVTYAGFFPGIERLGGGVEIHAAAFQQKYFDRRVREREGEGNTRGSAAHDRKIGREFCAGWHLPRIDERQS